MVELKQIKELMAAMQRTGTKKLVIKKEGIELELERESYPSAISEPSLDLFDDNPMKEEIALHRAKLLLSRAGDLSTAFTGQTSSAPKELVVDSKSTYVTSPMVGTFYSSPSPDDPPFIKPGDKVEKDTVVCIVEAMKVMNEVKAGQQGVVAEVLVDSSQPVEFGTKLFRITPNAS